MVGMRVEVICEFCSLRGDLCYGFFDQKKWRKRCGGSEGGTEREETKWEDLCAPGQTTRSGFGYRTEGSATSYALRHLSQGCALVQIGSRFSWGSNSRFLPD